MEELDLSHLSPDEQEAIQIFLENREELLKPVPRFKKSYLKLMDLIRAYSGDPSTARILELGCHSGEFVEWLREQGYDAEGIDANREVIEDSNKPYLHHGNIACLEDAIGKRTFGYIVAANVLNIGTQIEYLFGSEPLKPGSLRAVIRLSPERERAALENIERILMSTFQHLLPGGFFMTSNEISEGNQIGFTPEIVKRVGFEVIQPDKSNMYEAVLQRPY